MKLHKTQFTVLVGGFLLAGAACGQAEPYSFTTLAGDPGWGFADGTNNTSRFNFPCGVAVDKVGNVFVADTLNHAIRKLTLDGTNWVTTTIAGTPGVAGWRDGTNSAAGFDSPQGIAVDGSGNLFVADTENYAIRKITPAGTNWVVKTIASLPSPTSIAVSDGGDLFVLIDRCEVLKLVQNSTNWAVTSSTVVWDEGAGYTGTNSPISFNFAFGLAVDNAGNVFVGDIGDSVIYKLSPVQNVWLASVVAGLTNTPGHLDGTNGQARFNAPAALAIDNGGIIYVTELNSSALRMLKPDGTNWIVSTVDGVNGIATNQNARLTQAYGIAVDGNGNLFVANAGNFVIKKFESTGEARDIAGTPSYGDADGIGAEARFSRPMSVLADGSHNVWISDMGNSIIRLLSESGVVRTVAGVPGMPGFVDGTNETARFESPFGMAFDNAGNILVADASGIRRIVVQGTNYVVTTIASRDQILAGDQPAHVNFSCVAMDHSGILYVTDGYEKLIRKLTPDGTNWMSHILAGNTNGVGAVDGLGTNASFDYILGIAMGEDGCLYVGDNSGARKVTPEGAVTTLPVVTVNADGTTSSFPPYSLSALAFDAHGNFFASSFSCVIWKFAPVGTNWVATAVGGTNDTWGYADGTGIDAMFYYPWGISVNKDAIYVADSGNNTIREGRAVKIAPPHLQMARSSEHAVLSWPLSAPDYFVETTGALGSNDSWIAAGDATLSGGKIVLTNEPSLPSAFYRLRRK